MQFCKRILGVKKTTQNDFIYGELGRCTFRTIRLYNIIKYWLKVINCENNKYVSKIYFMLKNDLELFPNKINWCTLVKDLLCTLGFYDAWLFQNVGDEKVFLFQVKQRLNDHFVQNWLSRIENSSRSLFYRNIADFKFKPYLNIINLSKYRKEMTKLRVSSHRLFIETGRWTKPSTPIDQRICYQCNKLEDEFHFIIECELYKDIRATYISPYYRSRPNMYKFLELIKSENKHTLQKLAQYIFHAFELRNRILYN